ncbi:hypothetical protein [Gimesia maris]|uniref:hypothetical protein n=1 Tax=Gimesia maris TaxID=122 RepID=UPI0030DC3EC7|tara:strand:- start:323 stop:862 length:540 start_codon:yes stop_codon:yes gene_type:complete
MVDTELRPGCCRTLRDLSRASGISYTSVKGWRHKEGFPVEEDGTFNIWAVCEWRLRTFEFNNVPAGGVGASDPSDLKRRKLEADTAIAETDQKLKQLKFDIESGKLVDRDAAKRWISTSYAIIRHRLESSPAEHAGIFPESIRADTIEQWRRVNRLILKQLANYMNQTPGIDEEVASVD